MNENRQIRQCKYCKYWEIDIEVGGKVIVSRKAEGFIGWCGSHLPIFDSVSADSVCEDFKTK